MQRKVQKEKQGLKKTKFKSCLYVFKFTIVNTIDCTPHNVHKYIWYSLYRLRQSLYRVLRG